MRSTAAVLVSACVWHALGFRSIRVLPACQQGTQATHIFAIDLTRQPNRVAATFGVEVGGGRVRGHAKTLELCLPPSSSVLL